MNKLEALMEKILVPIATKLNAQRHVCAVRDAFILTFPITMAGAIIVLLNFVILSPDGFIASLLHLGDIFPNLSSAQAIFSPVLRGSNDILALLIVFLVGRNVAQALNGDDILAGLASFSVYFIVYQPARAFEGVDGSFISTQFFAAQGLFVALIIGLIVGEVVTKLGKSEKLQIKMPDQVPPAVARSFKILIPIIMVTIGFAVVNYIITKFFPEGLHALVYEIIQKPLTGLSNNVGAVVILLLVSNFLWVLGIHGPNTIAAIQNTMFAEANVANLNYVNTHGQAWGAPYTATWALTDAFANYGGSGCTLGLVIAVYLVSKRADYRDIIKLSTAPGLFNINEPIIFGLPVVLNPMLIIPFVVAPVVNVLIGYGFISAGLIPPVAYAVPWTTPGPLIAFLGTGGNIVGLLVGLLCLAVATVIYLPFVIAANKSASEDQGVAM